LDDEDKDRILKTVFIFRNLPEQQIGQLSSKLAVQHLAAGTTIFNEGDEGSEFYIIRKGVVLVETGGRDPAAVGGEADVVHELLVACHAADRLALFQWPPKEQSEVIGARKQTFPTSERKCLRVAFLGSTALVF